jgi:hypothetical protein
VEKEEGALEVLPLQPQVLGLQHLGARYEERVARTLGDGDNAPDLRRRLVRASQLEQHAVESRPGEGLPVGVAPGSEGGSRFQERRFGAGRFRPEDAPQVEEQSGMPGVASQELLHLARRGTRHPLVLADLEKAVGGCPLLGRFGELFPAGVQGARFCGSPLSGKAEDRKDQEGGNAPQEHAHSV